MENFTLLLKKYADFIVRVGVNPQPGQTLVINCCLEAAPLARLCVRSAYEAGARDVLVNWSDNDISRSRMELGSEEALTDFKSYQLRRYLDYAESEGGVCVLHILADDPEVYAGLDGAKISRVNAAQRKFMAPWREYTMNDRVQWSIAAMPSAPWAKKIFPELDETAAIEKLWQLIFDVCRVTGGDPVSEWKAHLDRLTDLKDKMNALDLESVHFESSNGTDLTVGIADKATWESAASVSEKGVVFLPNIPTEEVFTAPHKDKVNGIVYGTKPYVFNGQLIKGFHVTFKDGRVVEHGADEGAELLGRLLDTDEGARSIGEVALVPASSPINRSGALFYSTLFDENAACHIAFGASYPGTTESGTRLTKDELLALIGELTVQMREIFIERFKQINYNYGIVFAEMFGGGKGELKLSDPDDILHSGIEMHVQPPGKVILNLDVLSGGEKALAAIALLFAILKVTPSPFCVLDEIEAALDDVNVDRYAAYLRRMCDNTQFIAITHRRGTMEEADVLYGVTMQEQGVSKLLELRASEVEQKLGISMNQA